MSHRVDFYILNSTDNSEKYYTACRIIEKAYQQNHTVFILTTNLAESEKLNQLLWTFKDINFIPHALWLQTQEENIPIYIHHEIPEILNLEILINLSNEIPRQYKKFSRTIEMVTESPADKQIGRKKYRIYREDQCKLTTYTIPKNESCYDD